MLFEGTLIGLGVNRHQSENNLSCGIPLLHTDIAPFAIQQFPSSLSCQTVSNDQTANGAPKFELKGPETLILTDSLACCHSQPLEGTLRHITRSSLPATAWSSQRGETLLPDLTESLSEKVGEHASLAVSRLECYLIGAVTSKTLLGEMYISGPSGNQSSILFSNRDSREKVCVV